MRILTVQQVPQLCESLGHGVRHRLLSGHAQQFPEARGIRPDEFQQLGFLPLDLPGHARPGLAGRPQFRSAAQHRFLLWAKRGHERTQSGFPNRLVNFCIDYFRGSASCQGPPVKNFWGKEHRDRRPRLSGRLGRKGLFESGAIVLRSHRAFRSELV